MLEMMNLWQFPKDLLKKLEDLKRKSERDAAASGSSKMTRIAAQTSDLIRQSESPKGGGWAKFYQKYEELRSKYQGVSEELRRTAAAEAKKPVPVVAAQPKKPEARKQIRKKKQPEAPEKAVEAKPLEKAVEAKPSEKPVEAKGSEKRTGKEKPKEKPQLRKEEGKRVAEENIRKEQEREHQLRQLLANQLQDVSLTTARKAKAINDMMFHFHE
jgi:hypothetical protein